MSGRPSPAFAATRAATSSKVSPGSTRPEKMRPRISMSARSPVRPAASATPATVRPVAVTPGMPYSRATRAVTQAPQLRVPGSAASIGVPPSRSRMTAAASGAA